MARLVWKENGDRLELGLEGAIEASVIPDGNGFRVIDSCGAFFGDRFPTHKAAKAFAVSVMLKVLGLGEINAPAS